MHIPDFDTEEVCQLKTHAQQATPGEKAHSTCLQCYGPAFKHDRRQCSGRSGICGLLTCMPDIRSQRDQDPNRELELLYLDGCLYRSKCGGGYASGFTEQYVDGTGPDTYGQVSERDLRLVLMVALFWCPSMGRKLCRL